MSRKIRNASLQEIPQEQSQESPEQWMTFESAARELGCSMEWLSLTAWALGLPVRSKEEYDRRI